MSEDFYDTLLRCGLYFGAVFQLICIAAVIIIPDSPSSGNSDSKDADGSEDEISDPNSPLASPRKPHIHHRTRKPDKKKDVDIDLNSYHSHKTRNCLQY